MGKDGYLVLTRRVGEVLHIGDNIEIKVMKIKGQQAAIGIRAPREIKVRRDELPKREGDGGDG